MGIFKPQVNAEHKYAVAVPAQGGVVVPIQSFETLEQLKEGYRAWRQYATERDITSPVPIEFLDKSGKCKALIDIIKDNLKK